MSETPHPRLGSNQGQASPANSARRKVPRGCPRASGPCLSEAPLAALWRPRSPLSQTHLPWEGGAQVLGVQVGGWRAG